MRRSPGRAARAAALCIAIGLAWPARVAPSAEGRPVAQPPEPTPVPVTLGSVVALAKEVGWPAEAVVPKGAVRIGIRGENVDFDLFVQPATDTDPRGVQLVTFAVPQVVIVPASHALVDEILQRLMTLNWDRVVGHWSWDRQDGEIRFEYVHLTAQPMELTEFVAIVERVATTVDDDIRKIYKAMGVETPPPVTAGLAIERGEAPAGTAPPRARVPRPPPSGSKRREAEDGPID